MSAAIVLLFSSDRQSIFLVFRSDYPVWDITGGEVEAGESPRKAAIREALEETGFVVKIVSELGKYEFVGRKGTYETWLYEGQIKSGNYRPEFTGNRGRWFPVSHLPYDLPAIYRQVIADGITAINTEKKFDRKRYFSDYGFWKNLRMVLRHPTLVYKYFFKRRLI